MKFFRKLFFCSLAGLVSAILFFLPSGSAEARDLMNNELYCLSLNIYHEARGEGSRGMQAVASVTMNRAQSPRFPGTICGVVRQGGEKPRNRCQFSWWCDGKPDIPKDKKAWFDSVQVALDTIYKRFDDPTSGALFYHADYVNPRWSLSMTETTKIGQHRFYIGN